MKPNRPESLGRNIIIVLAGALWALLLLWPAVRAEAMDSDYFIKTFKAESSPKVKPGETVTVENIDSNITIKIWDKPSIGVTATLEMVNIDQANEELFSKETRVAIDDSKGNYRVFVVTPEGLTIKGRPMPREARGIIAQVGDDKWEYTPSAGVDLEVTVPVFVNLELKTEYGDILVAGIEGDVTVDNDSGAVKLSDIGGKIVVDNSYGDVSLKDCAGDIDIDSDSSRVVVENAGGRVQVRASYEKVLVSGTEGPVNIVNESGSVEAVDIGGELTVEGSYDDVKVARVVGQATVECYSGSVNIVSVTGDAVVTNSYAPVTVSDVSGALTVKSSSSSVKVERIDADVEVRTSYEGVEITEVGGRCRVTADSSPVRVDGVNGDTSIRSSYSEISAKNVGGILYIDGDSCPVMVDGVKGALTVTNSYEYVIVAGTESSIEIEGDSSPVEIQRIVALPEGAQVDVRTSYNQIVLEWPEGTAAEITARSTDGEIESEYPAVLDRNGQRKAVITIGEGGARVKLVTSGDIKIKKAR